MLTGLAQIDDGFNALGIPFFFKDDAETKAVQDALTPLLEKRIATQGFHLLAWTNGGWVQLFSKKDAQDARRHQAVQPLDERWRREDGAVVQDQRV